MTEIVVDDPDDPQWVIATVVHTTAVGNVRSRATELVALPITVNPPIDSNSWVTPGDIGNLRQAIRSGETWWASTRGWSIYLRRPVWYATQPINNSNTGDQP